MASVESLLFDLSTLKIATNDFSEDNKLGEGGFGAVYKVIFKFFKNKEFNVEKKKNSYIYLW